MPDGEDLWSSVNGKDEQKWKELAGQWIRENVMKQIRLHKKFDDSEERKNNYLK